MKKMWPIEEKELVTSHCSRLEYCHHWLPIHKRIVYAFLLMLFAENFPGEKAKDKSALRTLVI